MNEDIRSCLHVSLTMLYKLQVLYKWEKEFASWLQIASSDHSTLLYCCYVINPHYYVDKWHFPLLRLYSVTWRGKVINAVQVRIWKGTIVIYKQSHRNYSVRIRKITKSLIGMSGKAVKIQTRHCQECVYTVTVTPSLSSTTLPWSICTRTGEPFW
jgi:hypothetical protein